MIAGVGIPIVHAMGISSYIAAASATYVAVAVTEIASLRGQLGGRLLG